MHYHYKYRNSPSDYFTFYMGNIYKNWTGVINIIFTAAFLALMISRWGSFGIPGRIIMVFGLLLFPVLQPAALWIRASRNARAVADETELTFTDQGLMIRVQEHEQKISWKNFYSGRAAVKLKGILVLIPDGMHAYLLPDRVTGAERDELVSFLEKMIRRYSAGENGRNA